MISAIVVPNFINPLLTINKISHLCKTLKSVLIDLLLNIQVYSYGHDGILPPFYGTSIQNGGCHDIQNVL